MRRKIAIALGCLAIFAVLTPLFLLSAKPHVISIYERYDIEIKMSEEENTIAEAYIYDKKQDKMYSFLQYAHRNEKPETPSKNRFVYSVGDITYTFRFSDFVHPTISFPLNNKQYTIYNDTENIIIKRLPKFLPYTEEIVAPLPSTDCFYSPIELRDLQNTFAVLLMEPQSNGSDTISVYVQNQEQWEQIWFVLPDKTKLKCFNGYARRRFNSYTVNFEQVHRDPYVGDLELCQTNADGTATLYDVTYSDG